MGADPRAEDSDFILETEGLTKLKCEQEFEELNDKTRWWSRGGISKFQRGNDKVDDESEVRKYSNTGEMGGSHGGVYGNQANLNTV